MRNIAMQAYVESLKKIDKESQNVSEKKDSLIDVIEEQLDDAKVEIETLKTSLDLSEQRLKTTRERYDSVCHRIDTLTKENESLKSVRNQNVGWWQRLWSRN